MEAGSGTALAPWGRLAKTDWLFWGDMRRLRVLFLGLSPPVPAGGREVIWGGR